MDNKPSRNLYIDACRGVAAIQVVAAHTAFYATPGAPEWFRNIVLLFEVPFFFFLSGWGSSYGKPDVIKAGKGLLKIWAQWIVFILLIDAFCFISLKLPFSYTPIRYPENLLKIFFFDEELYPGFYVIAASTWFIPLYFSSIMINNAALTLFNRSSRPREYAKWYFISLILLMFWAYFHPEYFSFYPPFIMFYCAIWMVGYLRADSPKPLKNFIAEMCICLAGVVFFTYVDYKLRMIAFYDIQTAKTIPSGKYLFISMLSILIAGYLEKFIKKTSRVLVYIGKNALYYFFGQGVGVTVVYMNHLQFFDHWFLNWLTGAPIALLITVAVAEATRYIYTQLSKATSAISKKIRRIE